MRHSVLTTTPRPRAAAANLLTGPALEAALPRLAAYATGGPLTPPGRDPRWLRVIATALRHDVYAIEVNQAGTTRGLLPLAFVKSALFGRFLVSLPYLNTAGVLADDADARQLLMERAVQLADDLKVRFLELRHEEPVDHPFLNVSRSDKVHMRLDLPASPGKLWDTIPSKVRNQVRKGQKSGLTVHWGGANLLDEFYDVFARNMRDLGTPVYGRDLFTATLDTFGDRAEVCVTRRGGTPVAAGLLMHGWGVSEVPSASSLREHNGTCANMLMYWHLLERAVERGQEVFDFGRCTPEGNTYRFKKQWGATPQPAHWQYYLREGRAADMRPENPRYRRAIRVWQRLPVRLTRWIGPAIVRGIP
jgi:FemAB-related protein (PEP-CTERM system-associated)